MNMNENSQMTTLITMPAMAMPRLFSPVLLIWVSAMIDRISPTIGTRNEHTKPAMHKPFHVVGSGE